MQYRCNACGAELALPQGGGTCTSCGSANIQATGTAPGGAPGPMPGWGAGAGGGVAGGGWAPMPQHAVPGTQPYGPGAPMPHPMGPVGMPGYHGRGELDTGATLWLAIIQAALCCVPAGIVALVFLDQAKTAHRMGDFPKADTKLKHANITVWVGFGSFLVFILIYVFIVVFAIAASGP